MLERTGTPLRFVIKFCQKFLLFTSCEICYGDYALTHSDSGEGERQTPTCSEAACQSTWLQSLPASRVLRESKAGTSGREGESGRLGERTEFQKREPDQSPN